MVRRNGSTLLSLHLLTYKKSKQKSEPTSTTITVNPNKATGALFCQAVSVASSENEVVLEFIYVYPHVKNQGEVVARVVLPRAVAKNLVNLINQANESAQ